METVDNKQILIEEFGSFNISKDLISPEEWNTWIHRTELFLTFNTRILHLIDGDSEDYIRFLEALRKHLSEKPSIDDCRLLLNQCNDFKDLLITGNVFSSVEINPNIMSIDMSVIQVPVDIFFSDSRKRYKDTTLLADLTRFLINNGLSNLKTTLIKDDFEITKEVIISNYLKFFNIRKHFFQVRDKLIEAKQKREHIIKPNEIIRKNDHSQDIQHTDREYKSIKGQLEQNKPVIMDGSFPQTNILQFFQKVDTLLKHHAKILWITLFKLQELHESVVIQKKISSRRRSKSVNI
jgi:hypothetical protein